MVKQLSFDEHSIARWQEYKRLCHERFWDDLQAWQLREVKRLLQDKIDEEFDIQIGASRYERTPHRRDERNGHRYRNYEILGGVVEELKIPRARKLDIRFSVFDMWERVQPRVVGALTTAYLMGRSASTAAQIIEAFGQSRFSRSYLQRLVKKFEQRLKRYRQRRITKRWPYVFIDGMVVPLKEVYLRNKVVIVAYGMNDDQEKELLGWVVADSEDEISVRSLLIDLKDRGLLMPELFISDESKGIRAALALEYPHVSRQLCVFHKVQNIQKHLRDIHHRKAIMREAGDIYQCSSTRKEALQRFHAFQKWWQKQEPEAVLLFSQRFEETLNYFNFPCYIQKSLRTTNPLEQYIGKVRDWTSRFGYFQGRANLDLALFTFVCFKSGELLPDYLDGTDLLKPTLFIA